MSRAKRHTHKYFRRAMTPGGRKLWACAFPDCYHYMPEHLENLVIGKASICWKCEEKFVLDFSNMDQDKPVCDMCKSELGPAIIEKFREEEDKFKQLQNERLARLDQSRLDTKSDQIPDQISVKHCKNCGKEHSRPGDYCGLDCYRAIIAKLG